MDSHLAGQSLPSYFELIAQDRLIPSLRGAFHHVLSTLGTWYPSLARAAKYNDEIFYTLVWVIESHYLKKYDSSFAENFYGLKREAVVAEVRKVLRGSSLEEKNANTEASGSLSSSSESSRSPAVYGGESSEATSSLPIPTLSPLSSSSTSTTTSSEMALDDANELASELRELNGKDRRNALIMLALVPYIKSSLDTWYLKLKEEAEDGRDAGHSYLYTLPLLAPLPPPTPILRPRRARGDGDDGEGEDDGGDDGSVDSLRLDPGDIASTPVSPSDVLSPSLSPSPSPSPSSSSYSASSPVSSSSSSASSSSSSSSSPPSSVADTIRRSSPRFILFSRLLSFSYLRSHPGRWLVYLKYLFSLLRREATRVVKPAFVAAYPYVHMAIEGVSLAYQLRFLIGASSCFSPQLDIVGQRLRRLTNEDMQKLALGAQGGGGVGGDGGQGDSAWQSLQRAWRDTAATGRHGFVMRVLLTALRTVRWTLRTAADYTKWAIFAGLFAFKFVEWWHSSANTVHRPRASTLPIPPPPPPPASVFSTNTSSSSSSTSSSSGSGGDLAMVTAAAAAGKPVPLPADPGACPLCLQPRVNVACTPQGFVFCYACLFKYVNAHGKCPVTHVECRVQDIRKVYES